MNLYNTYLYHYYEKSIGPLRTISDLPIENAQKLLDSMSGDDFFTLGEVKWLESWYPNPGYIKIPLSELDPNIVSFTYGDTFPAFRYRRNNPTRGMVYTVSDIFDVVNRYGFPQSINPDGKKGPIRYIEAQIWSDLVISSSIKNIHIR